MDRLTKSIIVICGLILLGAGGFISWTTICLNEAKWSFTALLNLAVLGTPLFVSVGIFQVYRHNYRRQNPTLSAHVAWERYALPMALFVGMMVIVLSGLIYKDSYAAQYYAYRQNEQRLPDVFCPALQAQRKPGIVPSFGIGKSSLASFFTLTAYRDQQSGKYVLLSAATRIPSILFWLALLGATVTNLGTIMRRFVIGHLAARTYLHGAVRILYALFATLVIYLGVVAAAESRGLQSRDLMGMRHSLMLLAVFSGMYPQTMIQRFVWKMRQRLKLGGRQPLALTEITGIDPQMESFLFEEGIWSVSDLAARDPGEIAGRIHLPEDLVRAWVGQAKLYAALGERKIYHAFRKLGIQSWNDLKVLGEMEIKLDPADLASAEQGTDEISRVRLKVLKQMYKASINPDKQDGGRKL